MNRPTSSRRARFGKLGLALLAVAAANGLLDAGIAHAATSYFDLGIYPIPAQAPASGQSGLMVPTIAGELGTAVELELAGDTAQVLGIEGGSTAWGTPIVTAQDTHSQAQQWYFQLVGSVSAEADYGEPVYRVISYNGGSPTCLDVYGGGDTAGSAVDAYGCDPNSVNQLNQLWVLTGSNASFGSWVIENVASLEDNNWNIGGTPVVSATVADLQGVNSPVQLLGQTTWPADDSNSSYYVAAAPVTSPSSSSSGSSGKGCSDMFVCLLGL